MLLFPSWGPWSACSLRAFRPWTGLRLRLHGDDLNMRSQKNIIYFILHGKRLRWKFVAAVEPHSGPARSPLGPLVASSPAITYITMRKSDQQDRQPGPGPVEVASERMAVDRKSELLWLLF